MRNYTMTLTLMLGCFSDPAITADASSSGDAVSSSSSEGSTTSSETTTSSTQGSGSAGSESDAESSSSESTSAVADESSSSTGPDPIEDWAVYFGGSVSIESSAEIDLDLGTDFTIELWARIDSADADGPLVTYRGVGTTGWSLGFSDTTSEIVFGVYDANGAWHDVVGADAADLDPGWHHIAGTKHGTSLYVHVDGDLSAAASCASSLSAPVVPLEIGISATEDPLHLVAIDDVRLTNGSRYQAAFDAPIEIDADADTLVYLRLDEGDGTFALDEGSLGLVFDLQSPMWTPGNTR